MNFLNKLLFTLYIFSTIQTSAIEILKTRSTSTISDSIDIQHITIQLDITDFVGKTISGFAKIEVIALVDHISEIPFDLISLQVDSVKNEIGNSLLFEQNTLQVIPTIPFELNTGDSYTFYIYYHGSPEQDATWGGWYWSGDYAYQLGVAFTSIPHNYGRVWFPCFDNFIERCTYTFIITTQSEKKAFCGGILENEIINDDETKTWIWKLNQTIPSYLASISVSNYATVELNYEGIISDIPIQLAAKPEDTIDLKNSFIHLTDALSIFENNYGPYRWDRVGYSIVPFSGGAMEHAMNIAYPLFAVNGNLLYESLFVHELSHHWWGDLITCSSAQEMWLNEGWAVFSEHLFTENFYGIASYNAIVQSNHLEVLHYAAANDGNQYFAISNVPEDHTYGSTTYKKGADVIYTLRNYLGDTLFFNCITSFLDAYQFKAVSAADLKNHLSTCSGIDLNNFFDGWVYQPGFPAFEIEKITRNIENKITGICIEQKLNHASNFCSQVPLTISFLNENFEELSSEKIMMSGQHASFYFTPKDADFVVIDFQEKINDAVTAERIVLNETGLKHSDPALLDITVKTITDSVILYVQHFWVNADVLKLPIAGLHTNTQRYWKISGNLPEDFSATAKFTFNGKISTSGGYLDHEFITNSDDSLLLLYRIDQTFDWEIFPDHILNTYGTAMDKFGAIEIENLKIGEYAFGIYNSSIPNDDAYLEMECTSTQIETQSNFAFTISPNPTNKMLQIQFETIQTKTKVEAFDSIGRIIFTGYVEGENEIAINTSNWVEGIYILICTSVDKAISTTEKVMITH